MDLWSFQVFFFFFSWMKWVFGKESNFVRLCWWMTFLQSACFVLFWLELFLFQRAGWSLFQNELRNFCFGAKSVSLAKVSIFNGGGGGGQLASDGRSGRNMFVSGNQQKFRKFEKNGTKWGRTWFNEIFLKMVQLEMTMFQLYLTDPRGFVSLSWHLYWLWVCASLWEEDV